MKKTIFVLLMLLSFAAQAQYIIDEDSPDYLINPHGPLRIPGGGDSFVGDLPEFTGLFDTIPVSGGYFIKHYVEEDTNIFGIALTGLLPKNNKIKVGIAKRENNQWYYVSDTPRLDSSSVTVKFKYEGFNTSYNLQEILVDSYEMFFDNPVAIQDTFFIYFIVDSVCDNWPQQYRGSYFACMFDISNSQCWLTWDDEHGFIPFRYQDNYYISYKGSPYWGVAFPILRPSLVQCDTAEQFRVEEEGDGWTMLRWQSDGSGFYRLHIAGGDIDTTVNVYSTIYTIHGVTAGEEYTAELTHVCNFDLTGNGDTLTYSEPLTLTFTAALGIGEAAWAAALTMSPNPATDEVRIEGFGDAGLQADVMDVQGRRVAARTAPEGSGQLTLDVSHLPAGIYLVRLATPQGTATRRLVLTR